MRPPAPVPEGVVPAAVPQAPEAGVEERAALRVRRHAGVVPHPSPVGVVAFGAGAAVLRAAPAADRRQPRLEERPRRRRQPGRWQERDEAEREEEEENGDEYVSCVHGSVDPEVNGRGG